MKINNKFNFFLIIFFLFLKSFKINSEDILKYIIPLGIKQELKWTPKDDIRAFIVDIINKTNKSIRGAYYLLSDKEIGEALINAHKRGIKINLILDKGSFSYEIPHTLKAAGINIVYFIGKSGSNMHHKFLIVENKNSEKFVIFGSFNFTNNAASKNQEHACLTNFPQTINEFEECFKYLEKSVSTEITDR